MIIFLSPFFCLRRALKLSLSFNGIVYEGVPSFLPSSSIKLFFLPCVISGSFLGPLICQAHNVGRKFFYLFSFSPICLRPICLRRALKLRLFFNGVVDEGVPSFLPGSSSTTFFVFKLPFSKSGKSSLGPNSSCSSSLP